MSIISQLSCDLKLTSLSESGIGYVPVVMHPLNFDIIYLWNRSVKGLVLFNLRAHVLLVFIKKLKKMASVWMVAS